MRVKIARQVNKRVERYREFCGARALADLVERALSYVMDKDAAFRAHERGGVTSSAKGERRQPAKRVPPADKSGGAP